MARETPVRDVMTTDVVTVREEMPLEDAVSLLAEQGVSGAPVIDRDGALVGLLDDSDLLAGQSRLHAPTTIELLGAYVPMPGEVARFQEELRMALARTVAETMTTPAPSVSSEATCEDAATALVDHGVSRVAVVDDEGHLAGLVTRGDLVTAMGRGAV